MEAEAIENASPAADEEISSSSEDEAAPEMTEEEAEMKIEEDSKEFFGVRSWEEAEVYFTPSVPPQAH